MYMCIMYVQSVFCMNSCIYTKYSEIWAPCLLLSRDGGSQPHEFNG